MRAIPQALRQDPELLASIRQVEARHASPDELALAHDRDYIDAVRAFSASGGGHLDADTVASEGSWDAATAAAGAVLDAIDFSFGGPDAPRRCFCAVRPPGHHALRNAAMGFCLFGNIAIGALYARARHGVGRVLIVDWDVHHGNGTQALIEHERDIHLVSMHQWPWYPGTGAADDRGRHGGIWNLPRPPRLPPQAYVDTLLGGIEAATRGFVPDLVLISAGFDSLRGDPLGGFTLELEHVEQLTRAVVERADQWCGGRVVSALEGGYDPVRLAAACVRHLRSLQ